jgi:hypothetical protein
MATDALYVASATFALGDAWEIENRIVGFADDLSA